MRLKVNRVPILLILILLPLPITAQDQAYSGVKEAEEPGIVYGLVVDCSGSLRDRFNHVIEAAERVVKSNTQNDKTFIVRFVDRENVDLVQGSTQDQAALLRALKQLYVEGGLSAISDAVYLSAKQLTELKEPSSPDTRRRLLLITDGEDRGSFYLLDKVIPILREQKIQVFVLGLTMAVSNQRERRIYQSSIAFLNRVAEESGGRVVFVPKNKDWEPYVDELIKALRAR